MFTRRENEHRGWGIDGVGIAVCVGTADNQKIGDEGAILIAEALEKNTSLKELLLASMFPP
jgi:hypothetical protein